MLGMDFVCTDLMLDTGQSLYKILSPRQWLTLQSRSLIKKFIKKLLFMNMLTIWICFNEVLCSAGNFLIAIFKARSH